MQNIYDDENFFDQYAKMTRSEKGLSGAGEWHQFRKLFPPLEGKRVLDIGCGYGWHCKYAIEEGAAYVQGIDISEKMIETAKIKNADSRIEYKVCGVNEFEYPLSEYDVVISNLVLHYIENLQEIYEKVYRTLKKGGIFLINIEHPVFTSGINHDWIYNDDGTPMYWAIDQYFYPGKRTTNFLDQSVTKQHHTLTQIITGLLNTGFRLEIIEEAHPSLEMMHYSGMKDEMRRPMMLLIKAVK